MGKKRIVYKKNKNKLSESLILDELIKQTQNENERANINKSESSRSK